MALACLPVVAHGQAGVEEALEELGRDNAKPYTHPVTSGLGAGMVSGWFHTAEVLEPLHVEVGVSAMGALPRDEDDFFQPVLPPSVTIEELGGQTFTQPYGSGEGLTTPTAVGEGPGVRVLPQGEFRQALLDAGLNPSDFALAFPRGFDIPAVPSLALQGSLGLFLGTEATVRWLPTIDVGEDIGEVRAFGFGLKHSVDQYFRSFPVDVALAAGFQNFDAGDYLEADARFVALIVSKKLAVLNVYAAGQLEKSEATVDRTVANPLLPSSGTRISFEDEGDNTERFTLGLNLDLLFLQVNAGYTVAEVNVANVGVGLRF